MLSEDNGHHSTAINYSGMGKFWSLDTNLAEESFTRRVMNSALLGELISDKLLVASDFEDTV